MSEDCERCGKRAAHGVMAVVWRSLDAITDGEQISVCQRCSAWLLDRWDESVSEARVYQDIQAIDRPRPEPTPPAPKSVKRALTPAQIAQRTAAGKARAATRKAPAETQRSPAETQRKSSGAVAEGSGESSGNQRSGSGAQRNPAERGGSGGASSSFEKLNNSRNLEAEEATARARAVAETQRKSSGAAAEPSGRQRTASGERPAPLRILPPPPRPSIEGLPLPSELRRPNSAAERKQVAELLADMQIARQLANLYPLPLQERERPYFDDFALRALAGGDAETVVQGFGGWLQEEWTQEHRGPWLTWFRQWPGKLQARPMTPPPPQRWVGADARAVAALEAYLAQLRADGLTYPASQIEDCTPEWLADGRVRLVFADPFFRDFVEESYRKVLPAGWEVTATGKKEAAS